jgi:hypothetical protein
VVYPPAFAVTRVEGLDPLDVCEPNPPELALQSATTAARVGVMGDEDPDFGRSGYL